MGQAALAEDAECAPPEGDISASPASLFEAETMVAHAKDGSIVAVWVSNTDAPSRGGVQSIGYRVFRPHCHGWGEVQLIDVPGAFYHSDPTVVANDRGEFFIALLAASGPHTPPNNNPVPGVNDVRIYVAKLPRGAASVDAPVLVSQNPLVPLGTDKPWITVSPRGTPIVSYTQSAGFDLQTFTTVLARSTDDGRTWTEAIVDGGGFATLPQACTPRSGGHRVYVVNYYIGSGGGGGGGEGDAATRGARTTTTPAPGVGDPSLPAVRLHWSDDDGVTFREGDVNEWPVPDAGLINDITSCDARGEDVWLATDFATDANFDALNLHVGRFTDGGATFAEDIIVPFSADTAFNAPSVVAGIHEGLDLVMMTASFSGDFEDGRFLRLHSRDRGQTWSAPDVLATGLSFNGRRHDLGWLGDYFGATPTPNGGLDVTFPIARNSPTGELPQHVSFFELHGHDDDAHRLAFAAPMAAHDAYGGGRVAAQAGWSTRVRRPNVSVRARLAGGIGQ